MLHVVKPGGLQSSGHCEWLLKLSINENQIYEKVNLIEPFHVMGGGVCRVWIQRKRSCDLTYGTWLDSKLNSTPLCVRSMEVATPPNQDAKCGHTYHKREWWVG